MTETRIVKKALKDVGINARVTQGRGTACCWLHVNVGAGQQYAHDHDPNDLRLCGGYCPHYHAMDALRKATSAIIYRVTNRDPNREYGDNVLILTQDDWSDVPIVHDWAPPGKENRHLANLFTGSNQ